MADGELNVVESLDSACQVSKKKAFFIKDVKTRRGQDASRGGRGQDTVRLQGCCVAMGRGRIDDRKWMLMSLVMTLFSREDAVGQW